MTQLGNYFSLTMLEAGNIEGPKDLSRKNVCFFLRSIRQITGARRLQDLR